MDRVSYSHWKYKNWTSRLGTTNECSVLVAYRLWKVFSAHFLKIKPD